MRKICTSRESNSGPNKLPSRKDGRTWECWILPLNHWCKPCTMRKNIDTNILVAFAVVYY